jgi:thioesterase superfamily protein 4
VAGGLVSQFSPVATANLNVNFRRPVKIGQPHLMVVRAEGLVGRKIKVRGEIVNLGGEVCVESEGLMLTVQWVGEGAWKNLGQFLKDFVK